jgi:hypothetical protein
MIPNDCLPYGHPLASVPYICARHPSSELTSARFPAGGHTSGDDRTALDVTFQGETATQIGFRASRACGSTSSAMSPHVKEGAR